jgi:hypothetical protein
VAGVTAAALAVGVGVAAVQMSAKPDTDRSRKETAAAQQVQAGQYQSSLLLVYPGSEAYSEVFVEYADFNCAYIHTTDGRLVSMRPSNTDWEAENRWPEAVRWDMEGVIPVFYDAQGVLHAVVFQEAIACPNIRGEIVELEGSWTEDSNGNVKEIFANVLSLDDTGCVWETRYSASGVEEQLVFFCDVDTMEQFDNPDKLDIAVRVGESVILRSVIKGVVYESTRREPTDTSSLVYREGAYPVYVENTGIQFGDLLSGLDAPYMIWRGEARDVIYKDGHAIALPEGRSAEEIVFALSGRVDLIVFGDGAVYVNGLGEGLQYSEELTGLYRENKIRQTDMVGDLVLLVLDDNVTYMVVGGVPANPPAEEEQTQPPVEEAVPALPDSLDDITFTIGGQEFRLGMKLGELIDAGVLSDIKYYDETVEPLERSGISGKLVSGGSGSVMIYAWNLTRQETDIRDTTIVGITCNMENWTGAEKAQMGSVCLNGVPINTSVDHLTQIFGKANVHEKTYETDTERSGGWRGFDIADTYRLYITATESLDGGLHTFALEVKIISVDLIP